MKNVFRIISILTILVLSNIQTEAATYYSKSGQTVANTLTNWTLNADGTGASPANFTTATDTFVVQASHSYAPTANWTLGTNVSLKLLGTFNASSVNVTIGGVTRILNGASFTDNNNSGANVFTGLVTIESGGSLSTANTSAFTFTGGINNSGTFNKTGTGNVTFNGSQTITTNTAFTAFAGNATVTSGTLTIAGTNNINFAGTFTVNASQALVLTNSGITSFTGTFTNNGSFTASAIPAAANLVFLGNLTNAGTLFNAANASIVTTGNRTITATNAFTLAPVFSGTGTLTISGAGGLTLNSSADVLIPTSLTVSAASSLTLNSSGNTTVSTTTTVNGSLLINGKLFTALGNITVANGGTLDIGAGGFLKLANATSITNAGTFRAVGTLGSVATVSNNGSGNYTITQSASTGVFQAQYYLFDNLGTAGIVISNGSINATNNFSNGSFTNGLGGTNSTYLNLNSYDATSLGTINNASFGSGQVFNVTRTSGTGTVTFQNAQGALGYGTAGQQFERDNGIPGTLLTWITTGEAYTSQGSGNFSDLNNWKDGSNNSPSTAKLTDASSTFIIATGHTVTVDQNIQVASLQVSNGASLVIGNDGTARTVIIEGDFTLPTGANVSAGSLSATHTFTVKGNFTSNGILNFAPTSSRIVNLTLEGASKTITANATTTLNNLTFNTGNFSSVSYTLTTDLVIAGTVTINANATLTDGGKLISVAGNWYQTNANAFVATGKVQFNGSNVQSIGGSAPYNVGITFNKVSLNGTGNTVIFSSASTIKDSLFATNAVAAVVSNINFTVNGNFTFDGGSTYSSALTTTFGSATAQTIDFTNASFTNIDFSGAGVKTLKGASGVISGIFNITPTATVDGDATLNISGRIRVDGINNLSGTLNLSGTVNPTIYTGVANNTNFSLGNAAVNLNGSIWLGFVSPATSANLKVGGNITINNPNNIANQYLVMNPNTTLQGNGSNSFSLNSNATLYLRSTDNFPANFASYTLDVTSTSVYDYNQVQTIRGGITYGNLYIRANSPSVNTSAVIKNADGDLNIKGILYLGGTNSAAPLIYDLVTLNLGTFNHALAGARIGNIGTASITATSGTFTLNADNLAQNIEPTTGRYNFANFNIDQALPTASRTKTFSDSINVSGFFTATNSGGDVTNTLVLALGNNTITGSGGSSSFTLGANVILQTSSTSFATTIGTFGGTKQLDALSTIQYNANGNQDIATGFTYGNLLLSNSGNKTVADNLDINGNFTTANTANFVDGGSAFNHTVAGNFYISSGNYVNPLATITLDGTNQDILLSGSTTNVNNLIAAGSGTKTLNGTLSILSNFNINPSVIVDANTRAINIGGDFNIGSGQFIQTTGLTTFNGNSANVQNITSNSNSYLGALTINRQGANKTLQLQSDLTVNGAVILEYDRLPTPVVGYADFNTSGFNLTVGGNFVYFPLTTLNATGSTFFFNGANVQSIYYQGTGTFNNLDFSNAGSKRFVVGTSINSNTVDILGNFVNNGSTVDLSTHNVNLNVAGDWNNAGVFQGNGRTVTFNGAKQNISATSFGNVVIAGTKAKTLTGAMTIAGNLTIGANDTLDVSSSNYPVSISGNWDMSAAGSAFLAQNGTVTFTGNNSSLFTGSTAAVATTTPSTASVAVGKSFYNVVVNKASGQSLILNTLNSTFGDLKVDNDLTITTGTLTTSGYDVFVAGNFVNNEIFNANSGNSALVLNATSGNKNFDPGTNVSTTFRDIYLNAGTASYTLLNNLNITNNNSGTTGLILTSGTLNLNSKVIEFRTNYAGTVLSLASGATLNVNAGAFINFANGNNLLNAGGNLNIIGTSSSPATITRTNTGGYTITQTSGNFAAQYYALQYLNNNTTTDNGLTISGGTIDAVNNLSNGTFINGLASSKQYLNLDGYAGDPIVAQNVVFNTGPTKNVRFTTSSNASSMITFTSASGTLAGATYENDDASATTGKVRWRNTGIYWVGTTNSDWHTATNWSTGQVPTATDTVYLDHRTAPVAAPAGAYTVNINANATCFRLIIDKGASSNAIGLTLSGVANLTVVENVNVLSGNRITTSASTNKILVGGNWTFAADAILTATAGTVEFNPTSGIKYVTTPTTNASTSAFNNFTVNANAEATVMLSSPIFVNNDVTISGGTFDVSAGNLAVDVKGNWSITTGGIFNPQNGTVTFSKTGTSTQTINAGPFYNLTTSAAAATATKQFTGNISILNNVVIGTNTEINSGNYDVMVGGSWTNNATTSSFVQTGTASIIFNSTSATQSIDNGSVASTFGNLILQGAGAKNFGRSSVVTGDFTISSSSGTTNFDVNTITGSGANNTFVVAGANNIQVRGANNFPSGFETISLASNSTVNYISDLAQTIAAVPAPGYGNLTIQKVTASGTSTKTADGNIILQGGLTIADIYSVLNFGTNNADLTLSGNIALPTGGQQIVWGTGTSTLYHLGQSGWDIDADITSFNNVTLGGTSWKRINNNLSVSGNFVVNSGVSLLMNNSVGTPFQITGTGSGKTFNLTSGSSLSTGLVAPTPALPTGFSNYVLDAASTVTLNAPNSVNQLINSAVTYGNLVISNTAKNVTIQSGNPLRVLGTFTGTTNAAPNNAATLIDNGQDIFVGGDALFGIYIPSSNAVKLVLSGANQTVRHVYGSSLALANIEFNGTGTKTFGDGGDAITVGGNLSIASGVTVNSSNNITFSGSTWTNLGTWNHTANTVTFANTSALTINAGANNTFVNAAFTGTAPVTFVSNGATFTGSFTLNTPSSVYMGAFTYNIAGNVTLIAGTWTTNNASFNFNGGSQQLPALTAKDINLANAGTKTMNGAWAINNLTIANGVSLNTNATSNFNLSVAGNWNNSGTFAPNLSTVTFNGATSPITVNNNTSRFHIADFLPTAAVTYNLTAANTFINLTSTIGANANVNLQSNALIFGSSTYSAKVFTVNGTLDVTPNGALKFDNTFTACTMNVNGNFRLVGSSAQIASVSQHNTNNSYAGGHQININAGAKIDAKYYLIKDLADAGLYVDAAATLDATNNFSDGTWSNIRTNTTTPRRYLQLEATSPGTDIANVTFNYSGSPTAVTSGAYNVKRGASANGVITFVSALGGNLGDFKFEDDGAAAANATTGKIVWPVATNVTWTGAVNTDWNNAANWNPNIIPDATINATIPLATNNPVIGTADANCKNLIITNGQLTLQNAFDLNTNGDISIGTGTNVGVLTVMSAGSVINCQGNWTRGANGVYSHGQGKVVFTGATGASTITPLSSPFYTVEFNNHTSVFYIVGNTVNFAGDFIIKDGQVFPNNSNYNFNITGNVECDVAVGASFSTVTVGTITLNGANQSITDPTFSNLVISGTGVKSTTGVITILGTTTINSGATFAANPSVSNIDFRGNVTINAGGTFVDGGGNHTFSGSTWTGTGTYSGTGTVSFVRQGGQNQTINTSTFNNLNFSTGGGTVIIAGAITVNGDLNVTSTNGGVNINIGSTIASSNGVGTFTLSSGRSITCLGLNSFPANFGVYDLQPTSTVLYSGTSNQNVFGTTYANLTLSNTNTKSLLGDITVNGNLQFNTSTLDVTTNNFAVNILGTWFNQNTGTFIPRNGTVTFESATANQNINIGASATNPFYNLSINNPGFVVFATLATTVQNDLIVLNGTFSANGNTVYVGKNFRAISGTFANSGTYYLNYSGATVINIQTNGSTLGNLTIDGVGSTFICNDNLSVAGNFRLLNGIFNGYNKVVNLGSGGHAIVINGTYQIGAGGVMAIGNLCTVAINGTLVAVGTSSNVATITRNTLGGIGSRYSGFQVNSGGTIHANYYLIEYMGTGGIVINSGATIDAVNNFSNGTFTNGASGGTYLVIENNQKLTGANRIENTSFAINPGGGAKNVTKTSLPSDTVEFYNAAGTFAGASFENDPNGLIKWSGPVTLTWNGSVDNNWFEANNWTANFGPSKVPASNENVIIANTTNQPVISLGGATTANLTINPNAILTVTTVDTDLNDLNVTGDLNINGTFRLTSSNDGVSVAGNWQKATAGSVAISNGTVTFTAGIVKNINNGTGTFGNVIVNSTSTLALGSNTVISRNLTITSGTLDVSTNNYQLTIGGNFINSGTFLARAGKVVLNSTSGTKQLNVGNSALFNVDFTPFAGSTYQLTGILNTHGNVNLQAGTLNLNGFTFNMGDGSGSDFLAVNGGTLLINGNSALRMGNASNIGVNAGATIRIVGTASAKALIASQSGTYGITVNSGATIHAANYIINNINANGVYIKSGATIDATNNFNRGEFGNGTAGGTFLQLENSFADFTVDSVEFNGGVLYNVIRTTGTGTISFSDPSGATGNFSFEKDELGISASAGLIRWSYTTTTATWIGANGTDWNDPLNWNIGQIPSSTISAIVANTSPAPLITANAAANNVTLLGGAVLVISNNASFAINGNFTNNGTLTVATGSTSAISVGSNWADNGTFNPGASTVTLTANAGTKSIVSGTSSKFNNLVVSGTSPYYLASAITLNGSLTVSSGATLGTNNYGVTTAGNITINGTFISGTGTVTLNGTSGTQTITSGTSVGKTFYNLVKVSTSTSTLSLASDISVTNDLTVNKGNFTANNFALNVGGNYTWNNPAGTLSNADLVFTGASTKVFSNSSGASGNTFRNITFQKTAGAIILSNSITVTGTLTLNGGNLQLGARNLTLGTSANVVGGSASSYIQADGVGTVIKNLNNASLGTTYSFPVGDASNYSPMTFRLNSGTLTGSANIALNVVNAKVPNAHSKTLTAYLNRYWEVNPTGITSPNYDLTYTYAQADVVGTEADLVACKWSTSTLTNSGWSYGNLMGTWSINTASNTLSWSGITSFSRITAAKTSTPVPVQFLVVNASVVNDKVQVAFSTAQEQNNHYFVIESSTDGVSFDSVGVLTGAGNSNNVLHYVFETEITAATYYRVKQVDFDGQNTYSSVFNLSNTTVATEEYFKVYPNPSNAKQGLNIAYKSNNFEEVINVTIVDLTEKVHYNADHEINFKGVVDLPLFANHELPTGIYIITLKTQDKVYTQKLIVN
ncbi:MAG: hypothetical protein RLZZ175_1228 [Bacteroidota bacterium]|jgi:hypothetical protein